MAQTDSLHAYDIDEVTVTSLHLSPRNQHSTLVSADFSRMNITDISSALHRLPGITLRDYGGAGGMKTVSVRGLGSQHTGVCYDGVMLSDCQSGSVDLSRYSLEEVGSISLAVGDGQDIFIPARQSASASVLQIDSRKEKGLQVQLKGGQFGYISPYAAFCQPVSNHLTVDGKLHYIHAENDYPYWVENGVASTTETRANSRMNSANADVTLAWKPDSANCLQLKVYGYMNDRRLPGLVRYYTTLSKEELRESNWFAHLAYSTVIGEQLCLKSSLKYNRQTSDYRDPLYPGNVMDAKYWQQEYYATASVLYTPLQGLAIDYSADCFHNSLHSSLRTDTRPYRNSLLQSLACRWTESRFSVVARVLRSDYFNGAHKGTASDNHHRWSPSLLAIFTPLGTHLSLRASYKEIFRMPSFDENYYFHYGSTDLRPENARMMSMGTTYESPDCKPFTLSASADVYYNRVTDKIVAVPYNMFIWKTINMGKVNVLGFDATASARYRFSDRLTLSLLANYSLQSARNRTNLESANYGKQIAYIPLHSLSCSAACETPWVNLSVSQIYVGERWSTNEHHRSTLLPYYSEWGMTLWREFRFWKHMLKAVLECANLFNHQYEIVAGYPMPGRNIKITLNYRI